MQLCGELWWRVCIRVHYNWKEYSIVQWNIVQCSELQYSTLKYSENYSVDYSRVHHINRVCIVFYSKFYYNIVYYSTVR